MNSDVGSKAFSLITMLSKKRMRYLVASVLCFLCAFTQAHACRGFGSENTLFFQNIPDPQPAADVIAKVVLSDFNVRDFYKGTATARVLQITRATDRRVQQGGIFPMKFMVSSCGPHRRQGNEGTIVAKVGADGEGRLVLYPYLRRYSDDHVTPPCVGGIQENIFYNCMTESAP